MVALPSTSAWYSYGIGIRRQPPARTAAVTSAGSPVTLAVTSTLRSHVVMDDRGRLRRGRSRLATSLSRTCPPDGVSISRFPSSVRLLRTWGWPQTTTSKIFDCSYRLPTISPDVSVVASRRTSPGRSPYRSAAARLTLMSTIGCHGHRAHGGLRHPGHPGDECPDLPRLGRQRRDVGAVDADDEVILARSR